MDKSGQNQILKSIGISLLILFAMYIWTLQPNMINYQTILNNSTKNIWVHAPSNVNTGESFNFHVQAWDNWERLSSIYDGIVSFNLLSFNLTTLEKFECNKSLPAPYQFTRAIFEQGLIPAYKISSITGKDCGKHTFSATIYDEGIHYLNITDNKGNVALSNPIIVKNEFQTRLYWGDIHGHSALCDGSGYLEDVWNFAKEVAYLDFAAITTHDDWTDYYGTSPNFGTLWEIAKASANRWNCPNEFISLVAYEWTSQLKGFGHMCVYYKGNDGEMFSSSYPMYESQDKLWAALRQWKIQSGSDVITIPHHTGYSKSSMYFDWSYYDPEFVPLVEIYSAHGSSEKINANKIIPDNNPTHGYYVQDALSMGYKVGIMASSDQHDGRLGHPILHTDANTRFQYPYTMIGLIGGGFRFGEDYEGGLIGIYAKNLTRTGVFSALKTRSCFGSTHVSRPFINFSINNVSIGRNDSTVYVLSKTSPRHIQVFIAADGNFGNYTIKNITLVKNNVDINSVSPNSLIYNYNYTDSDELKGMNYTYGVEINGAYKITQNAKISLPEFSINNPPSTNWNGTEYTDITDVYYIRILQNNGNMAWIGPIWVKIL
ncbi:MAG: DUF3604 domain-containing protein [Candidatus Helarchaeota archaeon]